MANVHVRVAVPLHREVKGGGEVPQAEDRAHHEDREVGVSP